MVKLDVSRVLGQPNRDLDHAGISRVLDSQGVVLTGSFDYLRAFFLEDVKSYLDALRRLEALISAGRSGVAEDLFQQFSLPTSRIIARCGEVDKALTRDNARLQSKLAKKAFRALILPFAVHSSFVTRALEKPLGYPGDYKMLEMIYDGHPASHGIGVLFDQYFLGDPYAEGVRWRKNFMRKYLSERIGLQRPDRILNQACGSCREVREIHANWGPVTLVCLDQDKQALDFSSNELHSNPNVLFVCANILDLIKSPEKFQGLAGQDVIYSIGLADYLPDKVLKRWMKISLSLLKRDGELLLAHKDRLVYRPVSADWYCDWTFFPRSEEELKNLLLEIDPALKIATVREEEGCIFYLRIMRD